MINKNLNCVDCGTVFFGSSSGFVEGYGRCSICQASRKANERFEKEMAERRKYERQSSYTHSSSPTLTVKDSIESTISGILTLIVFAAIVVFVFVFFGNSPKKEYSFYTPNNGSLKQKLAPGVVYHQYKCGKHSGLTDDPSSCVEISKEDFERFCNEFDGINTVDNKEILDWKTGEITSLRREVDRRFDNPYCRIEFTMILDGKVKTGKANVITWTVNAEGKLVPFSSYGSTRWK